jgi:E3 ubiquitin-protein ligase RNF216
MTCTKASCMNVQCYVCHKSCDYSHFNDATRGGKAGNCPLFDNGSVEIRHEQEVKAAEEAARKQAVQEDGTLDEKALQITEGMAKAVQAPG